MALIILGCFLTLCYWQYGNLKSWFLSAKYSDVELTEQIQANKDKVDDLLKQYGGTTIRDFTFAEEEQIRKGEITPDEAMILLTVPQSADHVLDTGNGSKDDAKTSELQKQQEAVIGRHIATLYGLKSDYLAKLGKLERETAAAYQALPKEEQNAFAKDKIVAGSLAKAAALENSCDRQVDEVLAALQKDLQAYDGDPAIVQILKEAYKNEKSLKKAYYLQRFQ